MIWAWIVRFAGGLIPFIGKPFGEWFGKILWVVCIISAYMLVYHWLTPPKHQTTVQAGGTVNYITYKSTFGCSRFPVKTVETVKK
jgi:hypothetical protein